jgi:DNA-binding PadR family transcriptional regulator
MKVEIEGLSETFDNRVRLGIMSMLMVNDWVEFSTFKTMLDLTDGRLASHLKVLEAEAYIEVQKQFIGRKPNTSYRATPQGRKAFNEHLDALEKLLHLRNTNPALDAEKEKQVE